MTKKSKKKLSLKKEPEADLEAIVESAKAGEAEPEELEVLAEAVKQGELEAIKDGDIQAALDPATNGLRGIKVMRRVDEVDGISFMVDGGQEFCSRQRWVKVPRGSSLDEVVAAIRAKLLE